MNLGKYIFSLLVLTTVSISVFSQNTGESGNQNKDSVPVIAPTDTSKGNEFDFFYSEEEETKYLEYKPIIGIGRGFVSFYGDVRDNYYSHPLVGRRSTHVIISKNINSFLAINFIAAYGKFTGNERTTTRNLNFLTEFLSGEINFSYNFEHLLKKKGYLIDFGAQRRLFPFLSLGLQAFSFNSKGDLKGADGNPYFFWSDGSIRNKPETPSNEISSVIVERDYVYETDLREANYDGLGKYSQAAFAIPLGAGFDLKLSSRITMRMGVTYNFLLNDLVDNVSSKGEGSRKGNSGRDNYLYSYITFKFDLFSKEKSVQLDSTFYDVDFAALDLEDEDGDNVVDLKDKCPGTPSGVAVDAFGCPLDDDKDGIPNYLDKELNSAGNAIVDLNGVTYTEEGMIAASTPKDAILDYQICDYYPSMCEEGRKFRQHYIEIPEKFKPLDTDKDGYISIEELNTAIDKFFDFESSLTIDDMYELNEFFFLQ